MCSMFLLGHTSPSWSLGVNDSTATVVPLTDFSKVGAECSGIVANGVKVSFFQVLIFLTMGLSLAALMQLSVSTISWSPRPGMMVVLVTRLGLLVRKMPMA